jgi:hypothetical protein
VLIVLQVSDVRSDSRCAAIHGSGSRDKLSWCEGTGVGCDGYVAVAHGEGENITADG